MLLRKALRLPKHVLNQSIRAFLVERYTYTMTLAHISMGPESDEWVLKDAAMLFPMMQNESPEVPGADADSISGGVHELFQLIPMISVLARHWRAETHLGIRLGHTITELSELRSAVASWQPSRDEGVRSLCGRLYQNALLVYIAACFDDEADSVQKAFDAFTAFLASIPVDSPISTTMCWPLAVSGSCARTKAHRQVIAQKLDQLSTAYASQSVRDTKRLLERLWERGEVCMANPLGLEDMMKKERRTVLLL